MTLDTIIGLVSRGYTERRLCCPCGGHVVLGGDPAPTYTCEACGRVGHDLRWLVYEAPGRAEPADVSTPAPDPDRPA